MLTSGAGVRRLETVDPYGPAGKEFALMIKELEGLGATSHVELGKQIQAALERIGASAYQWHLDKLFEAECAEVQHWPRPPGSR